MSRRTVGSDVGAIRFDDWGAPAWAAEEEICVVVT